MNGIAQILYDRDCIICQKGAYHTTSMIYNLKPQVHYKCAVKISSIR